MHKKGLRVSEDRRFCENCGTAVGETTNFCPNCGAAQRPNPEVPTGPPPPTPEAGRIRTPYTSDVPPAPTEQRRRRGRAIPTLIIALVCLIVLVILARLVLVLSGAHRSMSRGGYSGTQRSREVKRPSRCSPTPRTRSGTPSFTRTRRPGVSHRATPCGLRGP